MGGQDLVKSSLYKNCHNSRNSNDTDSKLGTLSKLEKRNTIKSKEFDNDVILTNYDAIIIFLIYERFGEIGQQEPRCNAYFSSVTMFYLAKTENRIKKSLTQPQYYSSGKRYCFTLKNCKTLQKGRWHQQILGSHAPIKIFSETTIVSVYASLFRIGSG